MLWYSMLLFLEGEKGCAVLVMCTEMCRFPFTEKERTEAVTKRESLNGKPYVGNLQVRFDEEEYALAEPRRGSQLCLEKLHLKLTRSFAVIASVCLSLSVAIADEVNHYYVNPDPAVASDDYDGTRKVMEPGTNHGPKRTLKGAMEIAGLKAGDIVHAARGVYSEGVMDPINDETASNRVSVVAGVGIVADEGNLVTFIEGYVPPTTPESISTNGSSASVRCVAFRKNDKTGYLKGFTLRNGSAPIKPGTGTKIREYYGGGISYGTVIDCIISNCFAVRGGGAGQATLIRSRIADCGNVSGYNSEGSKASVQASASIFCSFYDSHIIGDSTFAQTSVNSTFEGSLLGDSSAKGNAYNCSISGDSDTGINYNSCLLKTTQTLDVHMRPDSTKVIGKGNVEYYVYPAGFESEAGKDILGRPRLSKGKIDIGCYQYAPMTFYVDAVNGDDGWDGLAREHDGTEDSLRGPRKTLAASMKIDGLRSGDVVCALEGTYSEGLMYDSVTKATNRVVVAIGVGLVSDKGPERTIIEGAPSVQEGGIGTDSVRGVFLNSRGAYIKGFTVRNGYTPTGVNGAGIYLYGNTAAIDCRIVDNKAGGRHGAASSGNQGVLIRCYVSGCSSNDGTGNGAGGGSYFNCVFNGEGGKVYTQNGTAVNCLFLGKAQLMGKNSDEPTTSVYNCVFRGNSSPYRANLYRCIVLASDLAGSLRYEDGTLRTNDVSLVDYDDAYRPLPGSLAIDFGNSAYSASTADGGQFPAEWIAYADTDYSGGQRVYNGAIDAGAGEYDWRPDFGNVLGKGVSVTEASSMVSNDVENGRIALLPGKLSLEWSRKDIPVRTFTAGIEGGTGGALTILTNGAHFAEVASGHETFCLYVPQDDIEMSFSYDGDGCAYVSDMHCEAGFQFIVR